MNKSKIEWCDSTWNPVTGCLHNCTYCYARRIANRFGDKTDGVCDEWHDLHTPFYKMNGRLNPYPYSFAPTFHRYRLDEPQKIKKPSKIFVCSMADLFGDWVPDEWIQEVFNVVMETDHKYMFLTKNPNRYDKAIEYYANEERSFLLKEGYCDKCWFGTTVTCQEDTNRIDVLLKLPEGHKFLSIEPLLGPIDLTNYLHGVDWIIVGSQTGPGALPPKPEWVQSIIDQARAAGIPIFLKDNLNWPEKIQEWPDGLK